MTAIGQPIVPGDPFVTESLARALALFRRQRFPRDVAGLFYRDASRYSLHHEVVRLPSESARTCRRFETAGSATAFYLKASIIEHAFDNFPIIPREITAVLMCGTGILYFPDGAYLSSLVKAAGSGTVKSDSTDPICFPVLLPDTSGHELIALALSIDPLLRASGIA